MEFDLKVPEKYDLLTSVHAWIFPEVQPVPEKTWDSHFGRIFTIGSKQIGITLYQKEPGRSITVKSIGIGVRKKKIQEKLEQILGLTIDLEPVFEEMSKDRVLAPIALAVSGIRPYSADTLYESLIKCIIQQQISYKAANVITKRLVESITNETAGLYQFPDYRAILDFGIDGMKSIGLGYKIPYIVTVCEMIENGELKPDLLGRKSYSELYDILKPIKGIGQWTIQVLAISVLSDFSVYPFGDLGIQNVLGKLYNKGQRISKNKVIEFSESFGKQGPLILYFLMLAQVLGLNTSTSRKSIKGNRILNCSSIKRR